MPLCVSRMATHTFERAYGIKKDSGFSGSPVQAPNPYLRVKMINEDSIKEAIRGLLRMKLCPITISPKKGKQLV